MVKKYSACIESEIRNGHPWSVSCIGLRSWDWGEDCALLSDLLPEEQKVVLDWISAKITKRKSPNYRYSSYKLKHILHSDTGLYITNNQMKDAMLAEGFEPAEVNEINWHFCISDRSPAFLNR